MKKKVVTPALAVAGALALAAGVFTTRLAARDDDDRDHFKFQPNTLVVTRSVYVGNAATVNAGEPLPPGCQGGAIGLTVQVPLTAGGTVGVAVPCGFASDNGEAPNLNDNHNVWNNSGSDGSFGITSPILLDNISDDGRVLATLAIPTDRIVTSFSSKSELALNRSVDGRSLTFMGYHGGVSSCAGGNAVSPTAPNLIDVSASSTPGICDPTNPVNSSLQNTPNVATAYYRAVAEVDADGHLSVTDGNAYSGDNGRGAIKGGNGMYYMVGNDNSGNLSKKQLPITVPGVELVNGTGVELLAPGGVPPVPPNIGMIGRLQFGSDKPGKDTNFRGITIFDNTLYVSKGSGGNGINTVYQVGTPGTLPTGSATDLAAVPINILPGFPNTAASTNTAFPFGMFFANATTLYVCDEGDGAMVPPVNGNVADAQSLATAGLQKWVLQNGTWSMVYVLQSGLNIGVPYSVDNYPAALNPATGGCRNIAGRLNENGTATIWAVTSTISANGDQGADPNKLVRVTDVVSSMTLPTGDGDSDHDDRIGTFRVIRSARAGEVFRGVALAPKGHGDDDR